MANTVVYTTAPSQNYGLAPSAPTQDTSLIGKASGLFALYVVYVFVSGWAFNDYYYRSFGIDPKFLDINSYDILTRGFTILFTGSRWLWLLYVLVITVPLIVETAFYKRIYLRIGLLVATLLPSLVLVYLISRTAGQQKAKTDQGDQSTLPIITFRINDYEEDNKRMGHSRTGSGKKKIKERKNYRGQLLFFRADNYFIHHVTHMPPSSEDEKLPQVSIFKGTQLKDVKVEEHQ